MSKEKEKFDDIMREAGLDKLTKSDDERFQETMEKAGLEKLTKPLVHIAKVPALPGEKFTILQFETPEKREKWYEEQGVEIENIFGKIEMPENPVSADPDIEIED